MTEWRVDGDGLGGVIESEHGSFPYEVAHGQVRIHLPFAVDQEALRSQLKEAGWAVGDDESVDSQGWGPDTVIDGYYPCWLFTAGGSGGAEESILAFPPKDYQTETPLTQQGDDSPVEHRPYFGPHGLEEFVHWLPYLEAARQTGVPSPRM